MTLADVLRDETLKGDVGATDRRVFYTLTHKKEFQVHRTAKAVSALIDLLERKGLLDEEEIDDFLFNCVR